jgi:murein DD-endopeptidase MepM/ murein hydrolase activator NlpD
VVDDEKTITVRTAVAAVLTTAVITATAALQPDPEDPEPVEITAELVLPEIQEEARSRDLAESSRSGIREAALIIEPHAVQDPARDHPPAVPPPPPPPPPPPEPAPEPEPDPAPRSGYGPPMSHYRITAVFGQSGPHWENNHTGLDFAAPTGTRISAVAGGRVVFAGFDGPYGKKVTIRHEDGSEATYAHMSVISVGDRVGVGDKIGEVGATGNVTGPHLHLEIRSGGSLRDPAGWLADHGVYV